MKTLIRNILLFLFFFYTVAYSQTADEYLKQGIEYGSQGKFQEAGEEFQKSMEIDNSREQIKTYLQLTKGALSQKIKKEALVHFFKGLMFQVSEALDKSVKEYKESVAISPDFAIGYQYLAGVYAIKGEWGETIPYYKKALSIDPNLANVHADLAVAYYAKEQFDLAIKHYDKALELGYKTNPRFAKFGGFLDSYRKVKKEPSEKNVIDPIYLDKDLVLIKLVSPRSKNKMSYAEAVSYCQNLTEGGYNNWFLPSREQLTVAVEVEIPWDNAFLWSSSDLCLQKMLPEGKIVVGSTGAACQKAVINLGTGEMKTEEGNGGFYVRCMRGDEEVVRSLEK